MKKILLTTTALTMLAGAAAADVNVGVTARMGVISDSAGSQTEHRMRVNITGSLETDGGLTAGVWMRMQTGIARDGWLSAGGANPTIATGMSGSAVWISNGTMTLAVGNTTGAIGQAAGIYAVGGCGFSASPSYQQYCANVLGQGNATFTANSSGGGGPNVVRLDFALGSANVSVSGGNGNNSEVAIGFSLGSASIGVGYDNGVGAAGGSYVTATMDAGSATIGLAYARTNDAVTHWMVKASTAVGAGSVSAFVANDQGMNRYGINYAQSLGGGATAMVAVTNQSVAGAAGPIGPGVAPLGTTVTAGITFGF